MEADKEITVVGRLSNLLSDTRQKLPRAKLLKSTLVSREFLGAHSCRCLCSPYYSVACPAFSKLLRFTNKCTHHDVEGLVGSSKLDPAP